VSHITVSVDIAAPPSDVWRAIEPIEDHVQWMQDAVSIRFATDQTRGVGTRTLVDTRVGPFRVTDRMTVTEWVPGEAMGVEHTGVVAGQGRFTLRPAGDGTRFAWDEHLRFPWWLGGPIGGWLGGNLILRTIWRHNLLALKRLVETGPPGPAAGDG
jgi:uncharacterized protein YndB with AHSA1/START domain